MWPPRPLCPPSPSTPSHAWNWLITFYEAVPDLAHLLFWASLACFWKLANRNSSNQQIRGFMIKYCVEYFNYFKKYFVYAPFVYKLRSSGSCFLGIYSYSLLGKKFMANLKKVIIYLWNTITVPKADVSTDDAWFLFFEIIRFSQLILHISIRVVKNELVPINL